MCREGSLRDEKGEKGRRRHPIIGEKSTVLSGRENGIDFEGWGKEIRGFQKNPHPKGERWGAVPQGSAYQQRRSKGKTSNLGKGRDGWGTWTLQNLIIKEKEKGQAGRKEKNVKYKKDSFSTQREKINQAWGEGRGCSDPYLPSKKQKGPES